MPFGWIDYSKKERNNILSVLDALSKNGTLDELGIGLVRDAFANLFFPGTSTIQTRAKYFFIVPYVFKDLERRREVDDFLKKADKKERKAGEKLLEVEKDEEGIVGVRSLKNKRWVQRAPSEIYWAGLRRYGIFSIDATISQYARAIKNQRVLKNIAKDMGNRSDKADSDQDDKDANHIRSLRFWNIPTYSPTWINDLSLKLTEEEGQFLKRQIITNCPDSFLMYILQNNRVDILSADEFKDIESLAHTLPEEFQQDYDMALRFSNFVYALRVVFNLIASENKNEDAIKEWEVIEPQLSRIANIDINAIFTRLHIYNDRHHLKAFLLDCQKCMLQGDIDSLKRRIIRREIDLKDYNRAKTVHPETNEKGAWFCGGQLDYRFTNAKKIIKDIFESEGLC